MAIENAKTLNVRIKNKYDSYENWASSGLVLEAGELAIAYTTVNVDIGNGKIEQHPELLMKVGDGSKTFANLPWLSAKAADVAAWAKAANKPTYTAAEITGIDAKIADYVSNEMGIEVDTDTQYKIVKVNDYQYKLMSKSKADADFTVEVAVIDIPNDTAAIAALETKMGEDSVATQIANALKSYSTTEQMTAAIATAKGEATGHADSLNSAMDARVKVVEGKAHEHANKAELDKIVEGDVAKWNAAEQNAKDHADGLDEAMDVRVKALEAKFGDGEGNVEAQIAAAVAAEAEIARAAEKANADAIDAIEADYLKAADKTALQEQITDNAEAIAALDTLVGDTAVATQISEAVAAEAEIARAAEKANADAIKAISDDYLKASDKEALQNQINTIMSNPDAEGAINSINEFAQYVKDHGTVAEGFRTDINANADAIEAIEKDYLKAADKEALQGEIDAVEGRMDTAEGKITALEGSVALKAAQADLEALAGRVTTVEGDLNTETTGLKARMTAAEVDIDALETKVGDETVAKQISAAIEALKIGDYAKAADLTAAITQHNTDKAALEAEIAKKANDADLAAIAKTGSTDDLVQGDLVLVFDCGTSAV